MYIVHRCGLHMHGTTALSCPGVSVVYLHGVAYLGHLHVSGEDVWDVVVRM